MNQCIFISPLLAVMAFGVQKIPEYTQDHTLSIKPESTTVVLNTATAVNMDSFLSDSVLQLKDSISEFKDSKNKMEATIEKLSRIKLSGYIQAQLRTAVSIKPQENAEGNYTGVYKYPVGTYSGGTFANDTRGLFQIRRGRLKTTYETDRSKAVLQINIAPEKVEIKHAYLSFIEPVFRSVKIVAGFFDVPYGFEVEYPSNDLASPERSRIIHTLFPGQQDIGIGIFYLPYKDLPAIARLFNFKGALINGTGTGNEDDMSKNFVFRTGITIPFNDSSISIDGGFSVYLGKITTTFDTIYTFNKSSRKFTAQGGRQFNDISRNYFGGDVETHFKFFPVGGFSLHGEVIGGKQPGSVDYSSVYIPGQYSGELVTVTGDDDTPYTTEVEVKAPSNEIRLYRRDFIGYYLTFVQDFEPIKSQLVVKWDVYDPNTAVSGNEFTAGSGLTGTDIKFSTLGLGWILNLTEKIKLITYYEFIFNEKVNSSLASDPDLGIYTKTLYDDVFTARFQYTF